MAKPTDRVQIQKQESAAGGGDAADASPFLYEPLDSSEDCPEIRGLFFQDATAPKDENVAIWRTGDDLIFYDISTGVESTLTDLTAVYVHPNHSGDVDSVGDGAQTIGVNKVSNAKAAQMAANTVKANNTGALANAADVAVGTNTVLGRVAGNIVAATLVNAQIADSTITDAKLATMAANTVKSNATAGTAAPSNLAMAASTMVARLATGNIVAATTTQIRTLLNVADGANNYVHPNHGGSEVNSVGDGNLTILTNAVANAKLAQMAANTVKANVTAGTANAADVAIGTNTVLGRVAGNIVAATLVNAQIADSTIANAKLASMAQSTFKGRAAGAGTGVPVDLTATQATAILNNFSSTLKGLAPLSGGGTTNFLRADGTWGVPPGAGATDHGALTGLSDDDHTQYFLVNGTRAITAGFNAAANTDATFNLGRLRIDSRVTDTTYLAHYDMTASSAFGLSINSSGKSTLNSQTGQSTVLSIGNTAVFSVDSVSIIAAATGGPAILNEVAGATNPTLIPGKGYPDSGLGGSGTTVYGISGGVTTCAWIGADQTNYGDLSVIGGLTVVGDIKHGDRTLILAAGLGPFFTSGSGAHIAEETSAGNDWSGRVRATGVGNIAPIPLPLIVGDRVKSIVFRYYGISTATKRFSFIYCSTASSTPVVHQTATQTLSSWSTYTMTLSSAYTISTGRTVWAQMRTGASGDRFFSVEVTYDHP